MLCVQSFVDGWFIDRKKCDVFLSRIYVSIERLTWVKEKMYKVEYGIINVLAFIKWLEIIEYKNIESKLTIY